MASTNRNIRNNLTNINNNGLTNLGSHHNHSSTTTSAMAVKENKKQQQTDSSNATSSSTAFVSAMKKLFDIMSTDGFVKLSDIGECGAKLRLLTIFKSLVFFFGQKIDGKTTVRKA
jgi:hypothetical protein